MRIACNANIHVAYRDEKKHFVLKSKGGKPRLLTVNSPPLPLCELQAPLFNKIGASVTINRKR